MRYILQGDKIFISLDEAASILIKLSEGASTPYLAHNLLEIAELFRAIQTESLKEIESKRNAPNTES